MDFLKINFQRVGWLLRQQVGEHWKIHLRYYLGLQVGFLIALLLLLYNAFTTYSNFMSVEEIMATSLYSMSVSMSTIGHFAIFCAFVFSATSVLSLNTERGKRIGQLMIPATTAEKVLSRFILFNLGSVLLTFISLLITDIAGYLVVEAYDFDYIWFLPEMLSKIGDNFLLSLESIDGFHPMLGDWSIQILPIYTLVMLWSIYLWGGAFFRKKSFIMTSLLSFIVFVIFVTISSFVILGDVHTSYENSEDSLKHTLDLMYSTYWMIGLLWFVLNLYFGYRIRKRASLMPRHWYGQ